MVGREYFLAFLILGLANEILAYMRKTETLTKLVQYSERTFSYVAAAPRRVNLNSVLSLADPQPKAETSS